MNKLILFNISIIIALSSSSCEKEPLPPIYKKYIHIAHTHTGANPDIYHKIEQFDYSLYDMLWLGGDMAYRTSLDDSTMNYADNIFDFGNPNTLWTLGNHDYSDVDRVQRYTNRPPFYSYYKNGIVFLVLDTQINWCDIVGTQKEMIEQVIDTISEASHLIVLHHKLVWMYNHPTLEDEIDSISNVGLDNCFFCLNPNNFNAEIYPLLVEAKNKEINVICIGGDIGKNTDEFEYTTSDGIHFLASGINANIDFNKVLIFNHEITNQILEWEYQLLE